MGKELGWHRKLAREFCYGEFKALSAEVGGGVGRDEQGVGLD